MLSSPIGLIASLKRADELVMPSSPFVFTTTWLPTIGISATPAMYVAVCVPFVPRRIVLDSAETPRLPISILLSPTTRSLPASNPRAMLLLPIELKSALVPSAVLLLPLTLLTRAPNPVAVFCVPVIRLNREKLPEAVLKNPVVLLFKA